MSAGPAKTQPPDPENRRHRRFSVNVEATVGTKSNVRIVARTRDVSQTGICLIGNQSVAKGEVLTISLVLAFDGDTRSEPLDLSGRVVWCTRIGDAYQIGAMFEEMNDEQDNFLEMFLQFLDGTLAPRGAEGYSEPDDDKAESPDDKDNPFR